MYRRDLCCQQPLEIHLHCILSWNAARGSSLAVSSRVATTVHFHYRWICWIFSTLIVDETCKSHLTKAQGAFLKSLFLSEQQSKTQRCSVNCHMLILEKLEPENDALSYSCRFIFCQSTDCFSSSMNLVKQIWLFLLLLSKKNQL